MTPSRRSVVLAGPVALLTALLAGCTRSTRRAPSVPRPIDPDVALRGAAAARERALVAALDRALLTAAGTPTGLLLADLRREHLVHLGALEPVLATPSPSTTPRSGGTPSPAAPAAAVPTSAVPTSAAATTAAATTAAPGPPADAASQQRLRRAQAARERAAATAHATATHTASPQLAALLAQLAASEASHAAVL